MAYIFSIKVSLDSLIFLQGDSKLCRGYRNVPRSSDILNMPENAANNELLMWRTLKTLFKTLSSLLKKNCKS